MSLNLSPVAVEKNIRDFIEKGLMKEGEILIENALEEIRTKLRKQLVQMCAAVVQTYFAFEKDERGLRMEVKLAEPKK